MTPAPSIDRGGVRTPACVYLVGSGPGDPGLLTLKAQARLREADLIVYDYLANPAHLKHASEKAVKICVGRGFRHKKLSQTKINRLIVRAAKKGRKVVRLKGGDPYLFGRGGEEALFLRKHGIPFQVVPGITSAVACAAYAGIPLTHRDFSSSVTFLTGHKADDKDMDLIPWKNIVSLKKGTLVIYMGFYNLEKIAKLLVKNGMPEATPAAVIEWGTLVRQRSCDGTLGAIAAKSVALKLKAPCIIVIGEVVSLRNSLNWFEHLPLFGKKIVLTRAREQSADLREKLEELGAEVIEFPTVRIEPPSSFTPMDRAIKNLSDYDWIVFSSLHGVRSFFDRLFGLGLDSRALEGCRIAAVGPQTAQEIQKRGVRADLVPERYETKALADAFRKKIKPLKGKNFLLVRAAIASGEFEESLKKYGARVVRVDAYRTLLPQSVPATLPDGIDVVTFTSASTVDHFVKLLGSGKMRAFAKKTLFASIGPVTSAALRKHGLKAGCEASSFTTEGLLEALQKKISQRS